MELDTLEQDSNSSLIDLTEALGDSVVKIRQETELQSEVMQQVHPFFKKYFSVFYSFNQRL